MDRARDANRGAGAAFLFRPALASPRPFLKEDYHV